MKIRLVSPEEAEACWTIRNLSIRQGCQASYSPDVLKAWTPEEMPEGYRVVITENPFFAVDIPDVGLVATGYLDVSAGSVEAIFTLPGYFGQGLASRIITTIKDEARTRGFKQLTLCATPNAQTFYERHGFRFIKENISPSRLVPEGLRCIDMAINL
ncbi:GNAT family N-acetyltransferase [Kluyvera genomosp. 1]|uniref:GNAT family N-acetyltransferase n=1 Tax=Kluyvera genomosp. 1 TaxID=2774053 RepID=UPI00068BA992|nr:GNAT family N-acetyltransferase [Kluyvera genomosp. 1]